MPIGKLKNAAYGLALTMFGKPSPFHTAEELDRVLSSHRVQGACIQCFDRSGLTLSHSVGLARDGVPVTEDTVFRTASIAKTVTALLVFRLQSEGLLDIGEDVEKLWGEPISSPYAPGAPVTLGMLMSHTSRIRDSEPYFSSFSCPVEVGELLDDPSAWLPGVPGSGFCYSNLAAGLIGCILEKHFGESLDALARRELFEPLGLEATYDISRVDREKLADSWRVLPPGKAFDAGKRAASAVQSTADAPEKHYLLSSGNLYLRAKDLAALAMVAAGTVPGFLNERSLSQLRKPIYGWPDQTVSMKHGMGLFLLDDKKILPKPVWGHQGFAYGAVNGLFFDSEGNGFVMLNSGASERREGHLSLVNRDLLRLLMGGDCS